MTVYKIDSQWEFALWCSGALLQPRGEIIWEVGRRFKKEQIYVYVWMIPDDVWQKPTQYYKAMILHLKIN